jgi:hypothetical protein
MALSPAESDGFLTARKIRSTTSFGGEVKPSTPCRKIVWHDKDPLRYDRDTYRQNSLATSCAVSHSFATRCLYCNQSREIWSKNWVKGKAVPLHAMEALGGKGGIAPTHSRPRH